MRKLILLYLLVLSAILHAEENTKKTLQKCGTVAPNTEWENVFQKQIQKFRTNNQNSRTDNNIVIPVIVHVVYYNSNTSQNISRSRIDTQIAILNRNFAGMSEFVNNTPTPFKPLIANTGITFCPAKISPNGTILTNPGIERINARNTYSDPNTLSPDGYSGWRATGEMDKIKEATIWDPTYYFNIWVVPNILYDANEGTSVLGYATFPTMTGLDGIDGNGTMTSDGIVVMASYFGRNSLTGSDGGTATHEAGHWLGLRHIWGDARCGNDYCDDTPTQKDQNNGCPNFPKVDSCNFSANGDMYMNYMDYVDDECYTMFTLGQKERMLTTMQNGNLRAPLLSSPVCDTILPAPVAKFSASQTNIGASNCATTATFDFTDKSMFAPTTWSWTFEGGTPSTSNIKNPTGIVFNTAGPKTVTLFVTSPRGQSTITQQVNISLTTNTTVPLVENFEGDAFPPVGWTFVKRSPDPITNWERRTETSGFGNGNASMIYNNTEYDAEYKRDDIFTPKLDLTGVTEAKLKFDVAYAPYYDETQTIGDTLEVYITDNCGNTSTMIYSKGDDVLATFLPGLGGEFYPTASQWRSDTVIIPAAYLNKPNVQIFFRNRGNYGHTIYVDNVNLFAPSQNPVPNFTMSKNAICTGENTLLTNTTNGAVDSVRWKITGGTPNSSISTTTVNPSFNSAGTYNITLFIFKDTYKDSITKSITVTNKPTPTINPSSTSVCPGTSVTLTASGTTTYVWNNGSTANPLLTTINSNSVFKVVGTTNGCSSDSVSITINAKTKPTVTVDNSNIQICPGESATFNASGATSYAWSNGQTGNSITVSPTVNTTYKVAGTTDGCTSDSVQLSVTIKTKPTINVTPQSTTICTGQSATLTASGAATYGWSNGQAGTSISISPTNTTTYKVAGTASNGCTSDSVSATVNITTSNPTVAITKNPNVSTICEGDSITLTATGANNYIWTTGQNSASIKVAPATQTSYGVVGSLSGCPTLRDSVGTTINVNAKPSVGTISRDASINWDTIFISPANGTNYLWFLNNAVTPVANTTVPYFSTTASGNGNYTVQIVDANGCKSDKSASFNVVVTSIRNNAASIGLKIFPNPNYGLFTIELSSQKYTSYELNIYNVAGRTIYQENFDVHSGLNSKKIQLQNIDKGIYFLSLKNEDGVATYQLLIQ